MRLGLFMMPLHPPGKDYHQMLDEDLEAVVEADRLGFDEVWVGEHFTCVAEPITSPFIFLAKAIPLAPKITFGTGVINLPQQHPVSVAGFAAMFDHLSNGRLILGIGPGGLPSDFELFGIDDPMTRGKMMLESAEIILKLWTEDPPYSFDGAYWQFSQDEWYMPEFGLGVLPKPFQKPHPPIAVTAMSPYPFMVKEGAKRDWSPISANFIPTNSVATHGQRYVEGLEEAGKPVDSSEWRVARTVLVTETDAEAEAYLQRPDCALRFYFDYLGGQFRIGKLMKIFKGLHEMEDDEATTEWALRNIVIAGSPETVAQQLLACREEVGEFGTLVVTGIDWDDKALWRNSMRLMAEEVMPRMRKSLSG